MVHVAFISPGYFETLAIPAVSGELFTWDDREGTAPVAVINEALAQIAFPETDAVGSQLEIAIEPDRPVSVRIAAVAQDTLYRLDWPAQPTVFMALAQEPTWYQSLVIKTSGHAAGLAETLQAD